MNLTGEASNRYFHINGNEMKINADPTIWQKN
jgi:hypothetical protein